MSYIEKEPIIEFITKGLNNPDIIKAFGYDAIEILTEIEYAPTVDVVPKSDAEKQKLEIWRLQGEVEQLERNLEQCENGYRQEMHLLQCKLKDEKDKVCEIFAEIENGIVVDRFCGCEEIMTIDIDTKRYAELKKKYTEASNEVQHS